MEHNENPLNVLESMKDFLEQKLSHLSTETRFQLAVVKEDESRMGSESFYMKMGNIFAYRFESDNWKDKINEIVAWGNTGTDIASILSPRNKGVETVMCIVAKMYFRINKHLSGETDFIREYNGKALIREFAITQYHIEYEGTNYYLPEIAVSWKDCSILIGLNAFDFTLNPKQFIEKRIIAFNPENN